MPSWGQGQVLTSQELTAWLGALGDKDTGLCHARPAVRTLKCKQLKRSWFTGPQDKKSTCKKVLDGLIRGSVTSAAPQARPRAPPFLPCSVCSGTMSSLTVPTSLRRLPGPKSHRAPRHTGACVPHSLIAVLVGGSRGAQKPEARPAEPPLPSVRAGVPAALRASGLAAASRWAAFS